jgi:putative addiction module component (TIGR02574 family)
MLTPHFGLAHGRPLKIVGALLSVEEQIELVEALWDNIVERNAVPGPTEAQKAELDRRLSEHAAHPDDVVPWSEVKDSALTRIRR